MSDVESRLPKARRTRLLDDEPADRDSFGGDGGIGPHERVATAVTELVTSPDEVGGKILGIEGKWGAGKTTVVNIIRSAIEKAEGFAFLSFDAWAHEGDPLRRTFLESLITQLQSKGWPRWRHRSDSV